jgi:protease I
MKVSPTEFKVAILATDGVERVELTEPRAALGRAGILTDIVAPKAAEIQSWDHDQKSERLGVDVKLEEAQADDYAGLLLPGGVQNPDKLRQNPAAVAFVKAFAEKGKPIAAICHGPWLLVEADVVDGLRVTSWPSLQTDLRNAGAQWSDEAVVEDGWLVTSRRPDDLPRFTARAISLFRNAPQPVGRR